MGLQSTIIWIALPEILFQVRLDNVWGVGGGIRPVKYLVCFILHFHTLHQLMIVLYVGLYFIQFLSLQVKKIILLLKEYLCSQDVTEASRCLLDLEVSDVLIRI